MPGLNTLGLVKIEKSQKMSEPIPCSYTILGRRNRKILENFLEPVSGFSWGSVKLSNLKKMSKATRETVIFGFFSRVG